MKKKSLNFITLCLLIFMTVGVTSCKETKAIDPSELEGFWVLKSLNGQPAPSLFEAALPTLQFDFKEMNVYGTGGCNRYTGNFTLEKNTFSAPNLASTKMLCIGKNEEAQFLIEFSRPLNVSVENGMLTFKNADDKPVLEFEKGEMPANKTIPEQLEGTWKIKRMNGEESGNIFKESKHIPTATFATAENQVFGNAGCNNYHSTYTLNDNTLIIMPVGITEMACADTQGEARFIKNITDTFSISFPNENILQLSKNDAIILEFEK